MSTYARAKLWKSLLQLLHSISGYGFSRRTCTYTRVDVWLEVVDG